MWFLPNPFAGEMTEGRLQRYYKGTLVTWAIWTAAVPLVHGLCAPTCWLLTSVDTLTTFAFAIPAALVAYAFARHRDSVRAKRDRGHDRQQHMAGVRTGVQDLIGDLERVAREAPDDRTSVMRDLEKNLETAAHRIRDAGGGEHLTNRLLHLRTLCESARHDWKHFTRVQTACREAAAALKEWIDEAAPPTR